MRPHVGAIAFPCSARSPLPRPCRALDVHPFSRTFDVGRGRARSAAWNAQVVRPDLPDRLPDRLSPYRHQTTPQTHWLSRIPAVFLSISAYLTPASTLQLRRRRVVSGIAWIMNAVPSSSKV